MIDTEELIALVKKNEFLYDMSHKNYKNPTLRYETWENIAKQLNGTSEHCRFKWNTVRDNYIKYKSQLKNSNSTKEIDYIWRNLEFLDNHNVNRTSYYRSIRKRKLETELKLSDESTYGIPTSPPPVAPIKSFAIGGVIPFFQSRQDARTYFQSIQYSRIEEDSKMHFLEIDETDYLFLNYSGTLKKLSVSQQTFIKEELGKLFSNTKSQQFDVAAHTVEATDILPVVIKTEHITEDELAISEGFGDHNMEVNPDIRKSVNAELQQCNDVEQYPAEAIHYLPLINQTEHITEDELPISEGICDHNMEVNPDIRKSVNAELQQFDDAGQYTAEAIDILPIMVKTEHAAEGELDISEGFGDHNMEVNPDIRKSANAELQQFNDVEQGTVETIDDVPIDYIPIIIQTERITEDKLAMSVELCGHKMEVTLDIRKSANAELQQFNGVEQDKVETIDDVPIIIQTERITKDKLAISVVFFGHTMEVDLDIRKNANAILQQCNDLEQYPAEVKRYIPLINITALMKEDESAISEGFGDHNMEVNPDIRKSVNAELQQCNDVEQYTAEAIHYLALINQTEHITEDELATSEGICDHNMEVNPDIRKSVNAELQQFDDAGQYTAEAIDILPIMVNTEHAAEGELDISEGFGDHNMEMNPDYAKNTYQ